MATPDTDMGWALRLNRIAQLQWPRKSTNDYCDDLQGHSSVSDFCHHEYHVRVPLYTYLSIQVGHAAELMTRFRTILQEDMMQHFIINVLRVNRMQMHACRNSPVLRTINSMHTIVKNESRVCKCCAYTCHFGEMSACGNLQSLNAICR